MFGCIYVEGCERGEREFYGWKPASGCEIFYKQEELWRGRLVRDSGGERIDGANAYHARENLLTSLLRFNGRACFRMRRLIIEWVMGLMFMRCR